MTDLQVLKSVLAGVSVMIGGYAIDRLQIPSSFVIVSVAIFNLFLGEMK